jgi:hypothetical protein
MTALSLPWPPAARDDSGAAVSGPVLRSRCLGQKRPVQRMMVRRSFCWSSSVLYW